MVSLGNQIKNRQNIENNQIKIEINQFCGPISGIWFILSQKNLSFGPLYKFISVEISQLLSKYGHFHENLALINIFGI